MRAGRPVALPVALCLLFVSVIFTPLAYADLPDQTWRGGLWDGGDDDDVILQLESTGATVDTFAVRSADPVLVVLRSPAATHDADVVPSAVSADQTRAPPIR